MWQIYPTFRCIKWNNHEKSSIWNTKYRNNTRFSILYTSYGSRTLTRQGRGNTMGFTPGQNNGVTQRVTKHGETTRTWEMSRLYLVIWIICGYMGYMLFYGLCRLFVVIIHNLIHIYIYMYVFGMFYPQSLFKHSTILLVYYGSRIPGPHKND